MRRWGWPRESVTRPSITPLSCCAQSQAVVPCARQALHSRSDASPTLRPSPTVSSTIADLFADRLVACPVSGWCRLETSQARSEGPPTDRSLLQPRRASKRYRRGVVGFQLQLARTEALAPAPALRRSQGVWARENSR